VSIGFKGFQQRRIQENGLVETTLVLRMSLLPFSLGLSVSPHAALRESWCKPPKMGIPMILSFG
jgi:hypothetical protein